MSSWFLLVVLVFVAFIALAAIKSKQGGSGSVKFPYQPAKALFSAAERSFLGVLDQAVGSEHRVFGKVRVADVAMVKPGLGKSARQGVSSDTQFHALWRHPDLRTPGLVEDQLRAVPSVASRSLSR